MELRTRNRFVNETVCRTKNVQDWIVSVFYGCLMLTGFVPASIISVVLLLCIVLLFFDTKFYILLPGLIVYYTYYYVPLTGLSMYRFYSLLAVAKLLLENKKRIPINESIVQSLAIFVYLVFAIVPENMRQGIFCIVDLVMFYLLYAVVLRDINRKQEFVGMYAVACIASVVTGLTTGSTMGLSYQLNGKWRETARFLGTFIDPNYCCMMYITAIFGCMFLKPFSKWQRAVVYGTLLTGILMTISFTGYAGLAGVSLFYMILTRKIRPKYFCYILVAVAIVAGLYMYGVENPDTPVLGDISYRVNAYIQNFTMAGDNSLGVNRLNIYRETMEAYNSQGIFKQIFGMNVRTPQLNIEGTSVAHNDYVDFLYNTGLVLTCFFYGTILYQLVKAMCRYRMYKQPQDGLQATSKVIWMYYAFVLTMITERQFYLVLFM